MVSGAAVIDFTRLLGGNGLLFMTFPPFGNNEGPINGLIRGRRWA